VGIEQLVAQCGDLIQAGQSGSVHKMLSTLSPESVPREHRLPVAILCRRVGLFNTGLRMLTPLVRPNDQTQAATDKELAEYARLLERSGTLTEALSTLEHLDLPEAPLYRAFCYMDLGEHVEAAKHFEAYLKRAEPTDQVLLSGRVGLASSWIGSGRIEDARGLLDEIISHDEIGTVPRALSAATELRAQVHIHAGRYADARTDLQTAAHAGSSSDDLQKWLRIIDALETGNSNILLEYRKEAGQKRMWESVREADRFLLKLGFDERRFDWLLFGTPYPSFRHEVTREHRRGPSRQELSYGSATASGGLNLRTGEFSGTWRGSPPPRLVHLLINALLKDFYRPISTGALFADLFPGEPFNVFTSIHRVHQAVHRARKWFEGRQLPILIAEFRGHYTLTIDGPFAVEVPYERSTLDAESRRLQGLISHFGERGFSARQAREELGMSPAVFKSLMTWAERNGQIARIGAGPATRYKING
jgi:tetratricopeptide (TPR) repeat protein